MIRHFFKATLVVSMVASVLVGCNETFRNGIRREYFENKGARKNQCRYE